MDDHEDLSARAREELTKVRKALEDITEQLREEFKPVAASTLDKVEEGFAKVRKLLEGDKKE